MKQASAIQLSIDYDITETRLKQIQRMRYRVYGEEMQLRLPGLDAERQLLPDLMDRPAIHIGAWVNGELTGAVRLNRNAVPGGLEGPLTADVLPRPYVYCARLFVLPEWRGSEVMPRLVQACFQQFAEQRAAVAICHCYRPLTKLYRRMGFHAYGHPFVMAGLEYLGEQTPMRCESTVWYVPQAA